LSSELHNVIREARAQAARGEYGKARKTLESARADRPEDRALLERQARTLEVLEGVDVVRRLLRDEHTDDARRAADSILEAMGHDEYAGLGVSGAALALLGRATEVADAGNSSRGAKERRAFISHLGAELDTLCRESVDRPLESIVEPRSTPSTLGDLLARKPWRSGLQDRRQALEAVPSDSSKGGRAHVPVTQTEDGSPVIGRILIEQERREREAESAASPHARTATGGGGQDIFEIVGKASLEYWHVVLFMGLIFATFGYLGMMATPDRYQSSALLQRSMSSNLRAPITNRPQAYVPSLPQRTVLNLVRLPAFHQRVADRLAEEGWSDGGGTPRKYSLSSGAVASALQVNIEDTGGGTYMIQFRAVHEDPLIAQAVAGAAADEFRVYHFEHITREAGANFDDYAKRQERISEQLTVIRSQRLDEFQIEDVEVLGVSLENRISGLIDALRRSRTDLENARLELRAAREELATQQNIADRLPQFIRPEADHRVTSRMKLLEDLEREWRELSRDKDNFGPRHPRHVRIGELEEEIELLKAEIAELERAFEEDESERKLNPDRAIAEDRVAKARFRVTLSEERKQRLEERIPRLEAELRNLREHFLQSEEMRRIEADLVAQHNRNEVVLEEIEAVRASADRELTLVSPAAPATMVEKNALVGIAIGIILGLVIGIGIAIGLLRRRHLQREAVA
jgi:hypothetical protein